jgi:hypothetical protein
VLASALGCPPKEDKAAVGSGPAQWRLGVATRALASLPAPSLITWYLTPVGEVSVAGLASSATAGELAATSPSALNPSAIAPSRSVWRRPGPSSSHRRPRRPPRPASASLRWPNPWTSLCVRRWQNIAHAVRRTQGGGCIANLRSPSAASNPPASGNQASDGDDAGGSRDATATTGTTVRTRRVGRRPTTNRSEGESSIPAASSQMARSPWEETLRACSGTRPTSARMPTSERLAAERAKVPALLRATSPVATAMRRCLSHRRPAEDQAMGCDGSRATACLLAKLAAVCWPVCGLNVDPI